MKPFAIVTIGAALLIAAIGCDQPDVEVGNKAVVNAWLVESLRDTAVENAIVRQHTVFPYQFVRNSQDLNDLGDRDVGILANHFKANPGQLNVRKGTESQELYRDRVETVLARLAKAGVDTERMKLVDDLAGGDGMTSMEVVIHFNENVLGVESDSSSATYSSSGTSETKGSE